jgi:hypothetical protein
MSFPQLHINHQTTVVVVCISFSTLSYDVFPDVTGSVSPWVNQPPLPVPGNQIHGRRRESKIAVTNHSSSRLKVCKGTRIQDMTLRVSELYLGCEFII